LTLRGVFSAELQPFVELDLGAAPHHHETIRLIFDTGFNGEVALSTKTIERLGCRYITDKDVNTPKGCQRARVFEVYCHNHGRFAQVIELDLELLGMSLCGGAAVEMEIAAGAVFTVASP